MPLLVNRYVYTLRHSDTYN